MSPGKKAMVFLLLGLLMLATACAPSAEHATPAPRRVGVLVGTDFRLAKLAGLQAALPAYGYVPGENIELVVKNAGGANEQLLPLAAELVAADVEVIVTAGRVETEAMQKALGQRPLPIVFMGLTGLGGENLVKDLLHPREGLTGVHNDHASLSGKRLELLVKLLPQVERVLVLFDPRVVPTEEGLRATREAATQLGVALWEAPVTTEEEIAAVLGKLDYDADAILLLPSVFLESAGAKVLTTLATGRQLPVMGVEHHQGDKGFFAIFGITPFDQGYQAARILAKVLAGQSVAEIPVEPPAVLKLAVNLRVAEELGLAVNPALLGYADYLYEEGGEDFAP